MEPLQGTLTGADEPRLAAAPTFERLALDDGSWVDIARDWLLGADTLLAFLVREVPWRQGRRVMYDRIVDEPRLSRWYGLDVPPPHPVLAAVRAALSARYHAPLGSIGLNYYRHGRDSVGWHRDRELRHLDHTLVAIVTLGAARPFLLRPRGGGPTHDLRPASGDLLVMGGRAQADWEHCVPKVATSGPRISVSLRWSSGRGRPERPAYQRVGSRAARAEPPRRSAGPSARVH